MTDNEEVVVDCVCCGKVIDPEHEKYVKLLRGWFTNPDHYELSDCNFERSLCGKCWLEDPDLCAFFNKLGLRIR